MPTKRRIIATAPAAALTSTRAGRLDGERASGRSIRTVGLSARGFADMGDTGGSAAT
jgi:hypothetical protein